MPGEDALGVGSGFPVETNAKNDITVVEVSRFVGGERFRIFQRRNPVTQDAAPTDFVEPNLSFRVSGEIFAETRINLTVQLLFEFCVIGMRYIRLLPDVLLKPVEIRIGILAGFFENYYFDCPSRTSIKAWT